MNLKRAPRTRAARLERLDALMDSYLHWRDESRAVAESYRNWRSAPRIGRDGAFDESRGVRSRRARRVRLPARGRAGAVGLTWPASRIAAYALLGRIVEYRS